MGEFHQLKASLEVEIELPSFIAYVGKLQAFVDPDHF